MNRLSKPVAIIVALVVLIFSVLSVFGISYYEGDNRHTIIKGFGSLDWGIDVSGGAKVVLTNATADEAGDINALYDAADIIEARAADFGLVDYQLYVSESARELVFVVPESVDSEFSAQEIAELLTSKGYITLRPGYEAEDSSGLDSSNYPLSLTPTGDTAATVIASSEMITDTSWLKYTEEGYDYYYISLILDEAGTQAVAGASAVSDAVISVWLDDRMIASPSVAEQITDGIVQFTDYSYTESKAKLYTAIIDNGVILTELSVVSSTHTKALAGNNATDIMLFAGIGAMIIIAVIMILRYKLVGVVSVFAVLLQFSAVLAVMTGFCFGDGTFMMTIPAMAAMVLSVMITVICLVIYGERIKSSLMGGSVIGDAVSSALKDGGKLLLDINVICALISLAGMFMFGTTDLVIALFSGGAVSGIFGFCYVLFFGTVFNFLSGYLVPNLMLRSLYSFDAFNKPSMFGGAK